jgi:hypothetical protein
VRTLVDTTSNSEESLISEGLDDELLRQLIRLLDLDSGLKSVRDRNNRTNARHARRHQLAARLCFAAGLSDQAEAETRAALAFLKDDEPTLTLLAAIHHQRGELGKSIRIHADLARRYPAEASALVELSRLFEASLRPDTSTMRAPGTNPEPALVQPGLHELEHALRLSFSGNLQQALRVVDRVALKARGETRSLYKLAILERAFLLEQAQDIRGAIQTLERLADEPGLASDVERLLCLAMLYEREGTVERIRRALRAVKHAYVVTRKPTLLQRIARLVGKLGHNHLASAFERRYFDIFRKRMHALTLSETVSALRFVYLPPASLSQLALDRSAALELRKRHEGRRRLDHQRRAALLSLCAGDDSRAFVIFGEIEANGFSTSVDRLYLADVLDRRGSSLEALSMRQQAITALDKLDAAPLVRLCAHEQVTDLDITNALLSPERLNEANRVLQARSKIFPQDSETLVALTNLARARGDHRLAREHQNHAQAITHLARAPTHLVLAAATFRCGGEIHGIIHELWVDSRRVKRGHGGLDDGDILGSVTPDLRTRIVAIFHAVRTFVRTRYPHRIIADLDDRRYFLRITKDDEPSSGDSAGLPIAVAFASVMLGFSVPTNMAFSGALIGDAHHILTIAKIGDADAKIEGAYERRLRKMVLPVDNREDVLLAERIPRSIVDELVVFVGSFDEVLALFGI